MPGRPRQSTAKLEALGAFAKNPQRRKDRAGEPVPPAEAPRKPAFLKGRAARIWDEYAPICVGMGTLCRGDEPEFAGWCSLQSEMEKDASRFPASGFGQKRMLAERFGIAGAGSRAKATLKDGKENADPADKYLGNTVVGPGNALRQ